MSTPTSPFMDHAAPVLNADPTLNDQQRSDLWDAFHTKSTDELVQHLTPLAIPDDTKHKLFQAKQLASPPAKPEPVDKVSAAINKMVALPPEVLDKAEQHPQVLKAFTTAATTAEPAPPAAPSEPAAAPKGKKTPETQKPALAPRADGQPHLPGIPEGHHRVLSSNGGVYDIPQENIATAQAADPNLHILNP
jgi:hypothetical protein